MKFFHNANIGKVLALVFAVGIHAAFGFGAYYLGVFIANLVLGESGGLGSQIAGVVYGVSIFLGAIWGFMYGEYALQDIKAYQRQRGGYKDFALYILLGFIGANELGSLGFRLAHVADPTARFWLGVVGLIMLGIAYLLGQVIHAMANRPLEVAVARMFDETRRSIVDDVGTYIPKMSLDQKLRMIDGDVSALDEVRSASDTERREEEERWNEQERKKRARDMQQEEANQKAEGFTLNLFRRPRQLGESSVPFDRTRQG